MHASIIVNILIFLHNTNNRNLLLYYVLSTNSNNTSISEIRIAMNNTEERDQILLRRQPLYTPRTEEHELV